MRFLEWVSENPEGVISLPTGKTPEYFIKWVQRILHKWDKKDIQLIRNKNGLNVQKKPNLKGLKFVQIDEFYPINPDQHNSFFNYVMNYYIDGFGLDQDRASLINCNEIPRDTVNDLSETFPDYNVDLTLRFRDPESKLEEIQQRTIYLVDQLTLSTLDLQTEDSYSFDLQEKGGLSATGDTNQALYPRQGQNRFQVLINSTTVSVDEKLLPIQYALHPAYPNPFNPITSLRYDLPEQAQVTLTVYNMLGREVAQLVNTTQEPGFKSVQWNATDTYGKPVSAGVYLYQIRAGEFVQTRKMVLLK